MNAAQLFYPPRCFVCRALLPFKFKDGGELTQRHICAECLAFGPIGSPITGHVCEKCGAPLGFDNKQNVCAPCLKNGAVFLRGNTALFLYEGAEREIILNLKYYLGPVMYAFVKELMRPHAQKALAVNADFIIPVPLYHKKQKAKGYNHAELLARALSELTGAAVLTGALRRMKNTKKQSGSGVKKRRDNVAGAFALSLDDPRALDGRTCLLVDDIFTSGATLNECARTLSEAGAAAYGFTFCVARPD